MAAAKDWFISRFQVKGLALRGGRRPAAPLINLLQKLRITRNRFILFLSEGRGKVEKSCKHAVIRVDAEPMEA